MQFPNFKNELKLIKEGYTLVAGCDEAGRGPMAGPVVAAACILDPQNIGRRGKNKWYARVRDSKTIPEKEREILAAKILENVLAWGVGIVSEEEIDTINIHHASLKAMRLAVESMAKRIRKIKKEENCLKIHLLVDGRFTIPDMHIAGAELSQTSMIAGDSLSLSISAASVIAKVERDAIMRKLHARFPEYGFIRHKGYNTSEHKKAIRKFGMSVVHRKSFVNKD